MKYAVIIICCLIAVGCGIQQNDSLVIGLIKPSLNHLPVQYALKNITEDQQLWQFKYFHSGWEANEALVAGRIDLAIMPFTYAWMDVSQNKKVKIISFLERESDGIIAGGTQITRLGVLKNSTLEIIPELMFKSQNTALPEFICFRTPMDMAAALQAGEVDAISYYVPSIYNLPDSFQIIDWYSHTFPHHPCCDLVANQSALDKKNSLVLDFAKRLQKAVSMMQNNYPETLKLAQEYYNLSPQIAAQSLAHTKYIMGLESSGKDFESQAAELMFTKGYLARRVKENEVYHQILP